MSYRLLQFLQFTPDLSLLHLLLPQQPLLFDLGVVVSVATSQSVASRKWLHSTEGNLRLAKLYTRNREDDSNLQKLIHVKAVLGNLFQCLEQDNWIGDAEEVTGIHFHHTQPHTEQHFRPFQ